MSSSTIISENTAFNVAESTIDQVVIASQLMPRLEKNNEVNPGMGEVVRVSIFSATAVLTQSAIVPLVNISRENCPSTAANALCMCRASQKVKMAMMASPTPAGISIQALPVIKAADIPLISAIAMQNGHGSQTAASVAGTEPRLGLPTGRGMLKSGRMIARAARIRA